MLKERNKACRYADELTRRDIHVLDVFRARLQEIVLETAEELILREMAARVYLRVRLRDDIHILYIGREIFNLIRDASVLHFPVRRLDEAERVDSGVCAERRDEPDVRPFRGFYWA